MGRPGRFPTGSAFKSFTGLTPKASETGNTDRKGQPMSKAGSSLLRTTLIRAADNARRQDPQLARIYHTQMMARGADHLKALCVVAAALADRAWAVMNRQMPYVVCDVTGEPVTPEQAKRVIAEHYTVSDEVRRRRRRRQRRHDLVTRHPTEAWTNEATFPSLIVPGRSPPGQPPDNGSSGVGLRAPHGQAPACP